MMHLEDREWNGVQVRQRHPPRSHGLATRKNPDDAIQTSQQLDEDVCLGQADR